MDYNFYLYNVVYYSYLLPLFLVAVLLLSGSYNKNLNLIVLLCISSSSNEFLNDYTYDRGINNHFLAHVGQAIDVMVLIAVFSLNVFRSGAKFASFIILDVVILFCICYGFSVTLLEQPLYASLLVGITIMCLVIYYYYEIFKYEHIEDLATNPVFWIKSTFLLYFAGTFAYYALFSNLAYGVMGEKVRLVNWILIMVCNLVFTLAIWLGRLQKA